MFFNTVLCASATKIKIYFLSRPQRAAGGTGIFSGIKKCSLLKVFNAENQAVFFN